MYLSLGYGILNFLHVPRPWYFLLKQVYKTEKICNFLSLSFSIWGKGPGKTFQKDIFPRQHFSHGSLSDCSFCPYQALPSWEASLEQPIFAHECHSIFL